ncbi:MAG TPA: type IX secretion system sortase PorU [Saprospiraceae bacterium]|mgnify:CR=1 FL=1|nr:type IX secretion system sortase PorU [Saprospiraceae bacterium]
MKKRIFTNLLFVFFLTNLGANPIIIQETLVWQSTPESFDYWGNPCERLRFNGCAFGEEQPDMPWFFKRFEVSGPGELTVQLMDARYEPFDKTMCPGNELVSEQLVFQTSVTTDRGRHTGSVSFIPVIRRGGRWERLVSFTLQVEHRPSNMVEFRDPAGTDRSALANGDIYKIAVTQDGVHRISQSFLRSLGINTDNLDPRKISIYGNGGGMLPQFAGADRSDDLVENHIIVSGEEDGRFDANDFILFYAQGPDRWVYNAAENKFDLEKNVFDNKNYYFIKIGTQNGARAANQASLGSGVITITTFDDYARFEEDRKNLLHEWQGKATGSGLKWFGEKFKNQREKAYNRLFSMPNLTGEAVRLEAEMALRAGRSSRFEIEIGGQTFQSNSVGSVILSGVNDNITEYARIARLQVNPVLSGGDINLTLRYPYPGGAADESEGWLDWIQINARRALTMSSSQMHFRSLAALTQASATYQIDGASSRIRVWDISDPLRPKVQAANLNGAQLSFSAAGQALRQFIAFDAESGFLTPEAVGKIGNQNYHGLDHIDMVILYHPDFTAEAQQLAQHRITYNDFSVALVRIDSLYNEFSSGRQDPTAIRDFAKMLYERNPRFRYLLLFGDASFDYNNAYGLGNHFIPTFQRDGLNPLNTHPVDDYFGLLTGTNPNNILGGQMNIAVGRLTVNTAQQAAVAVRKIMHYDNNSNTFGDWRNRLVFVGDDEDGNTHTRDANQVADIIEGLSPSFNIDKVFLDAYQQRSTPAGAFYPEVNEAINRAMFRGVLALTYFGHGGPKGLAQERIMTISDILSWRNMDNMPLLITATCTFGGFDDPAFVTAGEEAFLNENGGAIALFSTTRAVFANYNRELSEEALRQLINRQDGGFPTIGEALRRAKNAFTADVSVLANSRKFSLIGDPALKLKIPEYQVLTTKINTQDVSSTSSDTIRALQKVTIEGEVRDLNGQVMTQFNGAVLPTVFDKALNLSTLGQDPTSFPYPFSVRRNTLFKGRATVSAGTFRFTFVAPKDIDYRFGTGKIGYYAFDPDKAVDAAGNYNRIVVGGTDPNALTDNKGPNVDVFMNSDGFVFGSITNSNPVLLVHLEDENGINVSGNSIGHDLEGVLDEDTQNTLLLNDFYEADLDDYTKGKVRYPLYSLKEGRYKIRVKAWDVANNPAEGYTEFVVANSAEIALQRVLNYPNPFTDFTCFQFDHNLAGQEMDVLVQIFTVSGRLVKTLEERVMGDGALRLDDCIRWDGRDEYGDRLARGVYLYKVRVRSVSTGSTVLSGESGFEKLVILK